jgi:hypothetical protein
MTGKPVVFHPEAVAEAEAAAAWYQARSSRAGELFLAELEAAIEAVAHGRRPGYWRARVSG